jgi:hypothetical protein
LSQDQVLDELGFLVAVEHALIVEYLSISCALGHDLEADEGGATTQEGRDGASAASSLALSQMFRLKRINRALVSAERPAEFTPATSVSGDSGAEIALGPPSLAQLQRLVERGHGIAVAVDQRYARLTPAVTTQPVFEGGLLDDMRSIIVEDGQAHAKAFAALSDSLGTVPAADLLRATRREPVDAFEQRLLNVSDRNYGLVLTALRAWFDRDDFSFRHLAVDAMESLDEINRALVGRGLLPSFLA